MMTADQPLQERIDTAIAEYRHDVVRLDVQPCGDGVYWIKVTLKDGSTVQELV